MSAVSFEGNPQDPTCLTSTTKAFSSLMSTLFGVGTAIGSLFSSSNDRADFYTAKKEQGKVKVLIPWNPDFPGYYPMTASNHLKRIGADPIHGEYLLSDVDPKKLNQEIEESLKSFGTNPAWSRGEHVIRTAKKGGAVDRLVTHAQKLVSEADAVLLPGGDDIEGAMYGEKGKLSDARLTIFEMAILVEMGKDENRQKRMLGVCRGSQLIAVFDGYKMMDLPGRGHRQQDAVRIDGKETTHQIARKLIGPRGLMGEFNHGQGVDLDGPKGDDISVVARSPDGSYPTMLISRTKSWIGTQFHAEERPDDRVNQNIYNWLLGRELHTV